MNLRVKISKMHHFIFIGLSRPRLMQHCHCFFKSLRNEPHKALQGQNTILNPIFSKSFAVRFGVPSPSIILAISMVSGKAFVTASNFLYPAALL